MHPVEILLLPLGWALRKRRSDESASIADLPEFATANRIVLTSPNFRDGEVIPAKHCGLFIGDEISPALTWDELPAGTADLILVIEDLDVPTAAPGIHTIAEFAPRSGGLPEGALTPEDSGFRFLPNRRGQAKYVGPRPIPGHGTHRYRFHLYAVDIDVDLTKIADVGQLRSAVDGHVLASGTLTGTRKS
ncbi:YbhB/YbcL family Raf kinase inhibitor-like protein [Nocardia sp. BMG111209]|uniref:YbhB/YbcL family Raf kinase inhibitor-like protein n=1 Tax=Nocardia sp. BMG111209 TaxID=1160137 RepID=UPI0003A4C660|nr:YbhB/YbcL family Raf kinase inhibitor-like protein [Nocardia sp. BMG111209]